MRKFWIVMLAAALFLAFTMPAIAAVGGADVKFSGTLRMRGWYDDNISLLKPNDANGIAANKSGQAFYDNRLRMQMDFKVAEGLTLVTRFDALEKKWGKTGTNPSGGTGYYSGGSTTGGGSVTAQADSVSFERAYVDFTTGVGRFLVGYQEFTAFGTQFGDSAVSFPGIKYVNAFGPLTVIAALEKRVESRYVDSSGGLTTAYQDIAAGSNSLNVDYDVYDLGAIFKFAGGEAGIMYQYAVNNTNNYMLSKSGAFGSTTVSYGPYKQAIHFVDPYVKFKSGPVYLEMEGLYAFGKYAEYDTSYAINNGALNQDLSTWAVSLKAEMDFKPFYAGVKFAYVLGDDPATADKKEGSILTDMSLGQLHDFALMYGNYEYFAQVGNWTPKTTTAASVAAGKGARQTVSWGIDNAVAYQVYVGARPTPKLDVFVAYSYMNAQQKPTTDWQSDNIGQEVDLRASYKIFDNLSYTIGAGYFFTGDYFKGTQATAKVDNDYLLMHQLLLAF